MGVSQKKKQEALHTVLEAFELARIARMPYDMRWNDFYRLSEGIPGPKKAKWMTNRFIPYTPALIDLVLPRLASQRPVAVVTGWNEEAELKSEKFNQLLQYQQDIMHVDMIFSDWIYDAIRYGSGFLKIGWKKETAKNLPHSPEFISKIKAYFGHLGFKVKEDDLLYDGPTVERIDPFDLFIHPKATGMENALYMVHRSEVTKYDIQRNPNYDKVDFNSLSTGSSEIDEFRRQRLVSEGLPAKTANAMINKMSNEYFEVLEYWGEFDLDGDDQSEQCLITVLNRQQVIRIEENPHYHGQKPFVHLKYQSKPPMFYGRGMVERVADCQYELNDIANQASDMRKFALFPIIKINKKANIDLENIKIAPGLPIPLNDVNDLIFERPPDFTNQLEFMSKSTREIMQVATGATDVVLGQENVGINSETATGVNVAQEQSSIRFLTASVNVDSAIEKFGDMLIALNQQYYDRKKTIRIMGDAGVTYKTIEPTDITGQYSYKVSGDSRQPESRQQKLQTDINMYNLFEQDPEVNTQKLKRDILRDAGYDPDVYMTGQPQNSQALQQFQALPPAAQQAALAKMSPEDKELMMKAMGMGQQPGGAPGMQMQAYSSPISQQSAVRQGPNG